MKRVCAIMCVTFCVLALTCRMATTEASLKAEITSVGADNQATINKGSVDGVSPGMAFALFDDSFEKIGTFTILNVEEESSTGIYHIFDGTDAEPVAGMLVVFGEQAAEPPAAADAEAQVTLPLDTVVELELKTQLGSQVSKVGDVFELSVKAPVLIDGYEVITMGAKAYGEVTNVVPAKGWGKSGQLEITIKYVEAADGSHVPLSMEVTDKQKNAYAKMVVGAYMTGLIGGGAMKGKKIWVEPGTVFLVFVPQDTGISVETGASGERRVKQRVKKAPGDTKIIFLGLNDSFNTADAVEGMVFTSKLSTFFEYMFQWKTGFDFVKRRNVVEKTGYDYDTYFMQRGPDLPAEQRYNFQALNELGRQFGADYVIAGDIIKYDLQTKKKRDWMKTLGALSGDVSSLDGQIKQVFTMDIDIDMVVYDVARETVVWNFRYKDFHQVSKPITFFDDFVPYNNEEKVLDSRVVAGDGVKFKTGGNTWYIFKPGGYDLKRSDDPLAFGATDEGFAVLRTISPFINELQKIL